MFTIENLDNLLKSPISILSYYFYNEETPRDLKNIILKELKQRFITFDESSVNTLICGDGENYFFSKNKQKSLFDETISLERFLMIQLTRFNEYDIFFSEKVFLSVYPNIVNFKKKIFKNQIQVIEMKLTTKNVDRQLLEEFKLLLEEKLNQKNYVPFIFDINNDSFLRQLDCFYEPLFPISEYFGKKLHENPKSKSLIGLYNTLDVLTEINENFLTQNIYATIVLKGEWKRLRSLRKRLLKLSESDQDIDYRKIIDLAEEKKSVYVRLKK